MTYLMLLSRYCLYFSISAKTPYVLFLIGIGLSGHRRTLELFSMSYCMNSVKWPYAPHFWHFTPFARHLWNMCGSKDLDD